MLDIGISSLDLNYQTFDSLININDWLRFITNVVFPIIGIACVYIGIRYIKDRIFKVIMLAFGLLLIFSWIFATIPFDIFLNSKDIYEFSLDDTYEIVKFGFPYTMIYADGGTWIGTEITINLAAFLLNLFIYTAVTFYFIRIYNFYSKRKKSRDAKN